MRMTRKGAGAIALGLGVAMAAGACGGGAGAADAGAAPVADGTTPGYYEAASLIGAAQRVGAMEDFAYGDTFRATEAINLDLLYRVHPGYPVENDWLIWSAFEDNQNITFNRTDVLMADWDERRNLLIGAGDFPTLVPVVWPGSEAPWTAGGALLPVSDFFGYMPHFQHYVEEWGISSELENRRQENGNIYLLPGFRQSPNIEHSFMINVDLFEQAGITADATSFEELAEQLRAVQAATGVDYAFSDRWTDSAPLGAALNFVGPNFDSQGGWGLSAVRWNEDADAFVGTATADGYRDMVAFFAGLMADGVMDPEITQDDDSAIEKFINGRSAMITTNFQQMDVIRNDAAEAGIELNTRMITVPAGTYNHIAGGQMGPGFVLNANIADSPYFLATLQFLDWILYSESGREFAQWGVYGETWGRDADGNRIYLDNVGGAGAGFLNPNWSDIADDDRLALNATFGFQDGVWMNTWGGSDDLVTSVMPPEQRAWVLSMAEAKEVHPVSPAAPLTDLESEEISLLTAAINDHVHGQTALFILGQRPLSDWDSFVAEVNGMGLTRVIDTHNAALARARG